jgi:hypothetical protein
MSLICQSKNREHQSKHICYIYTLLSLLLLLLLLLGFVCFFCTLFTQPLQTKCAKMLGQNHFFAQPNTSLACSDFFFIPSLKWHLLHAIWLQFDKKCIELKIQFKFNWKRNGIQISIFFKKKNVLKICWLKKATIHKNTQFGKTLTTFSSLFYLRIG